MATLDRPTLPDTQLEPACAEAPPRIAQGELFARLMLRQLPVMKTGPEDIWGESPTMH